MIREVEIYKAIGDFKKIFISRFAADADSIELRIKSTQQFEYKAGPLWSGHRTALQQLTQLAQNGWDVYMYCENAAEVKRIQEILTENIVADKSATNPAKVLAGLTEFSNFHL